MGRATKWLRAVLGLKKSDDIHHPPPSSSPVHHHSTSRSKEKRRWNFVKSYREKDHFPHHYARSLVHQSQRSDTSHGTDKVVPSSTDNHCRGGGGGLQSWSVEEDTNKHAIAAAEEAAAEVVRLRSSGNSNHTAAYVSVSSNSSAWRDDVDILSAAVKIQSAFRGCLARKALRALKSLVRLQALVRGHIERKRTAEWLHCMQVLLRAQARARSVRVQLSDPPTPEKFEHSTRARSGKYEQPHKLKRIGSRSNNRSFGGDSEVAQLSGPMNIDKILEIDPGKPHFALKRRNLFTTSMKDSTSHQTVQSASSGGEVQSSGSLKFRHELEETYCTASNSPQLCSAASFKECSGDLSSPFTPAISDGSRSFLSSYSDHPNYMSTTESSKAKARSLSAPRPRPQYEKSSSTRSSSVLRQSALRSSFTSKAYPGSGRLDSLGLPIGQRY